MIRNLTSKTLIAILFTLIVIGKSNYSIGQNTEASKLLGNWIYTSQQGNLSLIFKSENVLVYDGSEAYYSLQPGVIVVQDEYNYAYYPYTLENDKLNITFPEGYMLTFVKANKQNITKTKTVNANNSASANYLLSGKLCHWSGSSNYSSSYSSSLWAYFDGQGNFTYGSESSYSGSNGIAYGGDNSGQNRGTYEVKGDIIILHFSDGSSGKATVHFKQDNGQITEIMYEGDLYASGLCD